MVDVLAVYVLVVASLFLSVMAFGLWQYGGDELMMRAMLANPNTRLFAQLAHAILYFSYFTIAHWYFGRTLGKLLFGLELTHQGSTEITFGRSLGRSLAYVLSGQITLGIGFLLPLFRKDGRTLHDLLLNTDVAMIAKASASTVEKAPAKTEAA